MGDHSESIEIDYDPAVISYSDLLNIFWQSHEPGSRPWSRQYMSAIFYNSEEQRKLALESRDREEANRRGKIYTEIAPASRFYRAEDYHQKYYLRQRSDLMRMFRTAYPIDRDFVDSTAAARANGYVAGHGSPGNLQSVMDSLIPPGRSSRMEDPAHPEQ